MNTKENYTVNWRKMPIEDKVLLCMEYTCYLLMIGTLAIVIFAIVRGVMLNAVILFFAGIGLIACGLSARSTREAFLERWKINFTTNNKVINYLVKEIKQILF
jgi:hypothetical protein